MKRRFNTWRLRRVIKARDKHPQGSPEWFAASLRVQKAVIRILK